MHHQIPRLMPWGRRDIPRFITKKRQKTGWICNWIIRSFWPSSFAQSYKGETMGKLHEWLHDRLRSLDDDQWHKIEDFEKPDAPTNRDGHPVTLPAPDECSPREFFYKLFSPHLLTTIIRKPTNYYHQHVRNWPHLEFYRWSWLTGLPRSYFALLTDYYCRTKE